MILHRFFAARLHCEKHHKLDAVTRATGISTHQVRYAGTRTRISALVSSAITIAMRRTEACG